MKQKITVLISVGVLLVMPFLQGCAAKQDLGMGSYEQQLQVKFKSDASSADKELVRDAVNPDAVQVYEYNGETLEAWDLGNEVIDDAVETVESFDTVEYAKKVSKYSLTPLGK